MAAQRMRQVFHQATVQRLRQRRASDLPYDGYNPRWQRKPTTFDSVEDALRSEFLSQETANAYVKAA